MRGTQTFFCVSDKNTQTPSEEEWNKSDMWTHAANYDEEHTKITNLLKMGLAGLAHAPLENYAPLLYIHPAVGSLPLSYNVRVSHYNRESFEFFTVEDGDPFRNWKSLCAQVVFGCFPST